MCAEYYDQSLHGPFDEIGISNRHCMLQGGYVLCPGLSDDLKCTLYDEETRTEKVTMSGIMGDRRPVSVPVRCDKCKEEEPVILLRVMLPGEETLEEKLAR